MQTTYTSVLARRIASTAPSRPCPTRPAGLPRRCSSSRRRGSTRSWRSPSRYPRRHQLGPPRPPGRHGRRRRDRGDPGHDLRQLAASHGSWVDTGDGLSNSHPREPQGLTRCDDVGTAIAQPDQGSDVASRCDRRRPWSSHVTAARAESARESRRSATIEPCRLVTGWTARGSRAR